MRRLFARLMVLASVGSATLLAAAQTAHAVYLPPGRIALNHCEPVLADE